MLVICLKNLITYKNDKKRNRSIYFLPGITGSASYLGPISDLLADTFNCYAIQSTGLAEGQKLKTSLEEEAQEFANIIWSQEPDNNLVLFGLSYGGFIGFEVAKKLEQLGYSNYTLLILDVSPNFKHRIMTDEDMDEFLTGFEHLRETLGDAQTDRLIKVSTNNVEMFTKRHEVRGSINNNIYCIKAMQNEIETEIDLWQNHTKGKLIVEKFDCDHGDIIDVRFHKELKRIVMSI